MDEPEQLPTLYPPWREALKELELAGIQPGQTIEKRWLEQQFGIQEPTTIAQAQKNQLLFLSCSVRLRDELLRKHSLMLVALPGVGYQVVEPADQTSVAMRIRVAEVNHALSKLMDEISYVRLDELDDAGRAANANARAKVGVLIGMAGKKLKLEDK